MNRHASCDRGVQCRACDPGTPDRRAMRYRCPLESGLRAGQAGAVPSSVSIWPDKSPVREALGLHCRLHSPPRSRRPGEACGVRPTATSNTSLRIGGSDDGTLDLAVAVGRHAARTGATAGSMTDQPRIARARDSSELMLFMTFSGPNFLADLCRSHGDRIRRRSMAISSMSARRIPTRVIRMWSSADYRPAELPGDGCRRIRHSIFRRSVSFRGGGAVLHGDVGSPRNYEAICCAAVHGADPARISPEGLWCDCGRLVESNRSLAGILRKEPEDYAPSGGTASGGSDAGGKISSKIDSS